LMRTMSNDLEQMASQGNDGMAADLARQAADRVRGLTSQLDGREPSELLDELRGFARRKPGTFLLGAFAVGLVAGRLARGAKDAQTSDGTNGSHSASGTSTVGSGTSAPVAEPGLATGMPLQGGPIDPAPTRPISAEPYGAPGGKG
jgi:hypothetical protein